MDRRDALKSLLALPAISSVEVARLRPDDVILVTCEIVVTCEGLISDNAMRHIQDTIEAAFPRKKCVVLGGGLRLEVVRSEA